MPNSQRKISVPQSQPKPATEKPDSQARAEIDLLREKISNLIRKSPDKAAILLTEWLKKPAQKPVKK